MTLETPLAINQMQFNQTHLTLIQNVENACPYVLDYLPWSLTHAPLPTFNTEPTLNLCHYLIAKVERPCKKAESLWNLTWEFTKANALSKKGSSKVKAKIIKQLDKDYRNIESECLGKTYEEKILPLYELEGPCRQAESFFKLLGEHMYAQPNYKGIISPAYVSIKKIVENAYSEAETKCSEIKQNS